MPTQSLEEQVAQIDRILRSVDGTLDDQVRIVWGSQRIVSYFRAAERQESRVGDWLYEPGSSRDPYRFPLDQQAALCEAHFLFICWDSIHKVLKNLRRNDYGFTASRTVLRRFRSDLERYSNARDHLEHLPERFPGGPHSDWRGDANSITGSTAGVRRDGYFVFQDELWDVSRQSTERLEQVVTEFVTLLSGQVDEALARFHRGESAMRPGTSA